MSLDRLGRSYEDIKGVVQELSEKEVSLKVLDADFLNFNTGNSLLDKTMFDMFLSLLSYFSQNEREKILERQKQGIKQRKKAYIKVEELNTILMVQIHKKELYIIRLLQTSKRIGQLVILQEELGFQGQRCIK